MPSSGARRFFSTSTASARSGDTYNTVEPRILESRGASRDGGSSASASKWLSGLSRASAGFDAVSRSMAHKNAARVLPLPVGAHTSVWSPATMGRQPCAWGGVASANVEANQALVGSENAARGSAGLSDVIRGHRSHQVGHRGSFTQGSLGRALRDHEIGHFEVGKSRSSASRYPADVTRCRVSVRAASGQRGRRS